MSSSEMMTIRRAGRRMAQMAACVILAISTMSAMADESSNAIVVRLASQVMLDHLRVTLKDVAEISGSADDVAKAGAVVVCEQGTAGGEAAIRSTKVSECLAAAGFDMNAVQVMGAAATKVSFANVAVVSVNGGSSTLALEGVDGKKRTLEQVINDVVRSEMRVLPSDAKVAMEFNGSAESLLRLTNPPYTFRVTRTSDRCIGLVGFRIDVMQNNVMIKRVPVMANVSVSAPVLVARRTINSKAQISPSDVDRAWRDLKDSDLKVLAKESDLETGRARRLVKGGEMITTNLLESIPLVRRGDLVTVVVRRGSLEIKTTARSLETGGKDDLVTLRNERSMQTFTGRPIRPGMVLVGYGPSGSVETTAAPKMSGQSLMKKLSSPSDVPAMDAGKPLFRQASCEPERSVDTSDGRNATWTANPSTVSGTGEKTMARSEVLMP